MTRREFFEMVIANVENEEMINFAKAEIEKMNTRNESRKNKVSKKSIENAPIKEKIVEFLTEKEPTVASEIAHSLELTVQKVSALCRQLVANEVLKVTEVKIKGKGMQKAYSLV